MVFNILSALKYLEEDIIDYSLIFSWVSIFHKQFIKSNGELEKKLCEKDKNELVGKGIISGTPCFHLRKGWNTLRL